MTTTICPSEAPGVAEARDRRATSRRVRVLQNAIRRRAELAEEFERMTHWYRSVAEDYGNALQWRVQPVGYPDPYASERRELTEQLARASRLVLSFGYRVYELEHKNRADTEELARLTKLPYLL